MTNELNKTDHSAGKKQMVSFLLTIGKWKKYFSEYESKLLIAEALNYCVQMQSLRIRAYLITGSELYLGLYMNPDIAHRVLMIFFEKIRRALHAHLIINRGPGREPGNEEILLLNDESYGQLFSVRPFNNAALINYLQGKKVHEPYYNRDLEYIKTLASGNDFCSLKDYTGATGPVLIDIKP